MSCEQSLDTLLGRLPPDTLVLGESNTNAFEINNAIIIKIGNPPILDKLVSALWLKIKQVNN